MKLNALLIDPDGARPRRLGLPGEGLRARSPGWACIVCTARSTVAQRVRGLRLGRRRLGHQAEPSRGGAGPGRGGRRAAASAPSVRTDVGPLVAGELEIRADQYQAFISGESIGLTRREFELLQLLADGNGQVIEREDIYQKVWGYAMAHGDRSVDVFVRKLRQKLQRHSASWRYIHTHFGIGYRFDPEPIADVAPASAEPAAAEAVEADRGTGREPTHPSRPRSALHTAFTGSSLERNDLRSQDSRRSLRTRMEIRQNRDRRTPAGSRSAPPTTPRSSTGAR